MTPADHANTVREALWAEDEVVSAALASLDALVAQAQAADSYARLIDTLSDRGEAAEAERDAAVRERDLLAEELGSEDDPDSWVSLKRQRGNLQRQVSELVRTARSEQVRANDAERERDDARDALRYVVRMLADTDELSIGEAMDRIAQAEEAARAALGKEPT